MALAAGRRCLGAAAAAAAPPSKVGFGALLFLKIEFAVAAQLRAAAAATAGAARLSAFSMAIAMAVTAVRRLPLQTRAWPIYRAVAASSRRLSQQQVQLDVGKVNESKPVAEAIAAVGGLGAQQCWDDPKSSINMEVRDTPGALYEVRIHVANY